MTKIGVLGANGRMGRVLIDACYQHADLSLGFASVRGGSSFVGVDAGEFVGVFGRSSDLCHQPVDISLGFTQDRGCLVSLAGCARKADGGRGFIQSSQGFNTWMVFRDAVFTKQAGGPIVPFSCV